ncbi:MAG: SHOCT domain-containing protein [Rhodospirillales bacterium]
MYWWNQPGMGYDGGGWYWGMAMHGIMWFLFLILIVIALVALVRYLWRAGTHSHPHPHAASGHGSGSQALAILEERYARGEIDREEYLRKKQDLSPST